jgi:membrane-bound serine protease (ClpP class)
VLFALEVKFTSHGVLGIGGTVLMVIGALLLVDGPIPQMRVSIWTALAVSIPMALITIFLMSIAVRAHKNKVVTGEEAMIGQIARVHTPLAPAGKVYVLGEMWNAVCPERAEPGDEVIVRGIRGLELDVEKVSHGKQTV